MVILICNNREDPIKNEGARVLTTFLALYVNGDFSRRSRAANSAICGRIGPNFALIQGLMAVLVTCKNEEDPIKNEGARVLYTLYIDFSDAQGQLNLQSVVGSGRNSSLPARMQKIQSKMKTLEC